MCPNDDIAFKIESSQQEKYEDVDEDGMGWRGNESREKVLRDGRRREP